MSLAMQTAGWMDDPMMPWLLLATGVTGGMTLMFLGRAVGRMLSAPLSLKAHFGPEGGCTQAVIRELGAARKEIVARLGFVQAEPLLQAMIEAKKRGLDVQILVAQGCEKVNPTGMRLLLEQGLLPKADTGHAAPGNSVLIIDQRLVIAGCFGLQPGTEDGPADNLLLVRNDGELAQTFRQDFESHRGHGQELNVPPEQGAAPVRKAA